MTNTGLWQEVVALVLAFWPVYARAGVCFEPEMERVKLRRRGH